MKRAIVASIVILICATPWLFLYSQASRPKDEVIAELQREVAANKKAIDDNHAVRGASDAIKVKILDLILVNLPTIITALGAAYLVIANARKNSEASVVRNDTLVRKTDDLVNQNATLVTKTDDLVQKTGVIHELANSNYSKIETQLQVSRKETDGLRALVESMVKDRDKPALAPQPVVLMAATTVPVTPAAPVAAKPAEAGQSDRIEGTGIDTNTRVKGVETHLGDRVGEVEAKLDEKKDKEKTP